MSKYRVTIPVVVFATYTVEASSEEEALQKEVRLSKLFYSAGDGGISCQAGCLLSGLNNDNADFFRSETELVQE